MSENTKRESNQVVESMTKEQAQDILDTYDFFGWLDYLKCPVCGEDLVLDQRANPYRFKKPLCPANASGHLYGGHGECTYWGRDGECPARKDAPAEDDTPEAEEWHENVEVKYCASCEKRDIFIRHESDRLVCTNGHVFTIWEEWNEWFDECEPKDRQDDITDKEVLDIVRKVLDDDKARIAKLRRIAKGE